MQTATNPATILCERVFVNLARACKLPKGALEDNAGDYTEFLVSYHDCILAGPLSGALRPVEEAASFVISTQLRTAIYEVTLKAYGTRVATDLNEALANW